MSSTVEITDRKTAIAISTINETRAHIGRALEQALAPCFGYVDRDWMLEFAASWQTSGAPHGGSTDYLYNRAISAAEKVQSSADYSHPYGRFLFGTDEHLVARAGVRETMNAIGLDLADSIAKLGGPVTKDWALEQAAMLQAHIPAAELDEMLVYVFSRAGDQ